ncbi:MAG: acetate/propionate family kinase [Minisyncoccia bacterium]
MKKYLIVNRGSASEKYAIYTKEKSLAFLHLEKPERGCNYVRTLYIDNKKDTKCITEKEFEDSLNYALSLFKTVGIISGREEISGIGIRIVAPGEYFQDDKIIDKKYIKEIKNILDDAPLHLLPTYDEILRLNKIFKNVPIVGVSDSDFHNTLPDRASYYGLPFEDTQKYHIKKYGYHGISIESILNKLKTENRTIPSKLIVCHIGSGVSVTAIKNGRSIENSMGFTPLEGVMMATRGGDIDPGTVAFVSDKLGIKGKKLKDYLNKKCGLLGVSGKSSDVRDLIRLEKESDLRAKLALDMYVYRLQKCIGSYFVALGGLDAIVFTATVGERSFVMREKICRDLEILGIKINIEINNKSEGVDVDISAIDSKVSVLVLKTDEMEQITRDTIRVLGF